MDNPILKYLFETSFDELEVDLEGLFERLGEVEDMESKKAPLDKALAKIGLKDTLIDDQGVCITFDSSEAYSDARTQLFKSEVIAELAELGWVCAWNGDTSPEVIDPPRYQIHFLMIDEAPAPDAKQLDQTAAQKEIDRVIGHFVGDEGPVDTKPEKLKVESRLRENHEVDELPDEELEAASDFLQGYGAREDALAALLVGIPPEEAKRLENRVYGIWATTLDGQELPQMQRLFKESGHPEVDQARIEQFIAAMKKQSSTVESMVDGLLTDSTSEAFQPGNPKKKPHGESVRSMVDSLLAEEDGYGQQKSDQTLTNDANYVVSQLRRVTNNGQSLADFIAAEDDPMATLLSLFSGEAHEMDALPGFDNLFSNMSWEDMEIVAQKVIALL